MSLGGHRSGAGERKQQTWRPLKGVLEMESRVLILVALICRWLVRALRE